MFFHKHPYTPYFPKNVTKLIVGTLPPPRFSIGLLKKDDVNFCYGSRDGLLWPVLDRIFDLQLIYNNSNKAIEQRKDFLDKQGIGICDIVESCYRKKVDASDLGMTDVVLRDLLTYLEVYPTIKTLLFTGGNSKNGPEYFFRRHLKGKGLKLELLSNDIPRVHKLKLEKPTRVIQTVSLTAPSGSANRAIGSMDLYKRRKAQDPSFNTIDFRVEQYEAFFKQKKARLNQAYF